MKRFDTHARFCAELEAATFESRLSTLRESLQPFDGRAFGQPAEFVIGAVLEADSVELARDIWFRDIDPLIDQAELGHGVGRYLTSPEPVPKAISS